MPNHSTHYSSSPPAPAFHTVIVGAGASGAYAARRLRKRFPGSRFLVLEKTDRIGGRLLSGYEVADPGQKERAQIFDELGGMRYFKHLMPGVAEAVEEVECQAVPVPLDVEEVNIFHFKGKRYRKKDFLIGGKRVTDLVASAVAKFRAETGPDDKIDMNGDETGFYNSHLAQNLTGREFFLKFGMSSDEIDALIAYGGYDDFAELYQASTILEDDEFYSAANLSSQHSFVAEGYATVLKRLLNRSNVETRFNSCVVNITRYCNELLSVYFEDTRTGGKHSVTAQHVFMCVTLDVVRRTIPKFVDPQRSAVLANLVNIPLFKCFLHWDDLADGSPPWWKTLGYVNGKHVTDLPLRMVWNYDKNDLLIYNSGSTADSWAQKMKEQGMEETIKEMLEIMQELFGIPIPPPNIRKTLWKHHPEGATAWLAGTPIPETIEKIIDGRTDRSDVYICGDAFSRLQGWVQGAFDSVDAAFAAARWENVTILPPRPEARVLQKRYVRDCRRRRRRPCARGEGVPRRAS